jgi:hypothetical protein
VHGVLNFLNDAWVNDRVTAVNTGRINGAVCPWMIRDSDGLFYLPSELRPFGNRIIEFDYLGP